MQQSEIRQPSASNGSLSIFPVSLQLKSAVSVFLKGLHYPRAQLAHDVSSMRVIFAHGSASIIANQVTKLRHAYAGFTKI